MEFTAHQGATDIHGILEVLGLIAVCAVLTVFDFETASTVSGHVDVVPRAILTLQLIAGTMRRASLKIFGVLLHLLQKCMGGNAIPVPPILFFRNWLVKEMKLLATKTETAEAVFATDAVEAKCTVRTIHATLEIHCVIASSTIDALIATFATKYTGTIDDVSAVGKCRTVVGVFRCLAGKGKITIF